MENLLTVKNLQIAFQQRKTSIRAVENLNFFVKKGEILGLVGESGCGKSITSLSLLRLLPKDSASVTGSVEFNGQELLSLSEKTMQTIRGNGISMIFQEPMTSLNPAYSIGTQLVEAISLHQAINKKAAAELAVQKLSDVGLPRAEKIFYEYPHQLSGGMRQRVMIAMALACEPQLLIADEPTTALDVTIQAQILALMKKKSRENHVSIILVTHDLGVVAELCERVLVMYAGQIVEEAVVEDLFYRPAHPYTEGLLDSMPKLDRKVDRLMSIEGMVPSLQEMPIGCRFAPRCKQMLPICQSENPPAFEVNAGHYCRCWLHKEKGAFHGEE